MNDQNASSINTINALAASIISRFPIQIEKFGYGEESQITGRRGYEFHGRINNVEVILNRYNDHAFLDINTDDLLGLISQPVTSDDTENVSDLISHALTHG